MAAYSWPKMTTTFTNFASWTTNILWSFNGRFTLSLTRKLISTRVESLLRLPSKCLFVFRLINFLMELVSWAFGDSLPEAYKMGALSSATSWTHLSIEHFRCLVSFGDLQLLEHRSWWVFPLWHQWLERRTATWIKNKPISSNENSCLQSSFWGLRSEEWCAERRDEESSRENEYMLCLQGFYWFRIYVVTFSWRTLSIQNVHWICAFCVCFLFSKAIFYVAISCFTIDNFRCSLVHKRYSYTPVASISGQHCSIMLPRVISRWLHLSRVPTMETPFITRVYSGEKVTLALGVRLVFSWR